MIDDNQINSLMFADRQRSSQLTELQQRWQQFLPVIICHLGLASVAVQVDFCRTAILQEVLSVHSIEKANFRKVRLFIEIIPELLKLTEF